MKKVFIGVGAAVAVVLVAAFAVLWLVDWSGYVIKAVQEATGCELRIGGEARLSLLPAIEFNASDVRLSNSPGTEAAEMVSVGAITAKVRFWPLLRRRVIIDSFVVREPAVFLEVDKAGRPNWIFKEPQGGTAGRVEGRAGRGGGLPISDLRLGDVRIEQGLFSYANAKTGQKIEAKDIALKAALADLKSLLSVTGRTTLNGEPVSAEVSVGSLQGALLGERSAVKMTVSSKPVKALYEGFVQQRPVPGLDGRFELDVPSVGQLASWLGQPLAQPDPGPLRARAAFAADGAKVALKEAVVEGRGLKGSAKGSFDGTGKVKKVALNVESGVLDIDRYLPPVAVGGRARRGPQKKSVGSGDVMASLPSQPLDLSGLRQVEGEVRVAIGGVKVSGFEVGRVAFTTSAKGGVLSADLSELGLYGGGVKGKIRLDGSGAALRVDSELSLDKVNVGRLVQAVTREKPVVTGIGSGTLNAAMRGASPRALAESLSGSFVFDLGGVGIKDGGAGAISEVKVNVALSGVESAPSLKGSVVYNRQRVDLDVTLDTVRKMLSGERFAARAAVSSKPVKGVYEGFVQQRPVPGLDGRFELDVPSVGRLASWLGQPLAQPDPGPLRARAAFAADGAKVALKEAVVEGRGLKASAKGSFDGRKPVALFNANVDVEQMDLDAYLPEPKRGETGAGKKAGAGKSGEKNGKGWSEEPFDLSPLSRAKADVQVKLASTRYRGLVIRQGQMAATVAGGVLKATIDDLKLAGGTVGAAATLDASGRAAALDYEIRLSGVEARPLLKAFAGSDRLSGKTELQARGRASGGNQRQLVQSLNGEGRFLLVDGAVHGINLAAALRKVKTLGFDAGEAEKTDFAELSGSFVIRNGVVDNRDLKLVAPLVRLSGGGVVPLPPRTVDYQAEANLVASLKGQGETEALAGLPIPIRIQGPWDNLAYKVDWKSVFTLAAKDPKRLKDMPKELREIGKGFGVPLPIPKIPITERLGEVLEKIPGFSTGKGEPKTPETEPPGEQPKQDPGLSLPGALKSLKELFGK